jgi:hypothetical protein
VEKLPGKVEIPAELDVRAWSSNTTPQQSDNNFRYCLTGAIVHVDPIEDEHEAEFGVSPEGHYITFLRSSLPTREDDDPQDKRDNLWTEIDDDFVCIVDSDHDTSASQYPVPKEISGCDVIKKLGNAKERRYATLVVYSRSCDGNDI